jgi:hypothetical protein
VGGLNLYTPPNAPGVVERYSERYGTWMSRWFGQVLQFHRTINKEIKVQPRQETRLKRLSFSFCWSIGLSSELQLKQLIHTVGLGESTNL